MRSNSRAAAGRLISARHAGHALQVYGTTLASRLLIGTAQYPSPAILAEAVKASGAELVTVSLRREAGKSRAGESFWDLVRDLGVKVLPNTAGCHSVKEAVTTAEMAREVFATDWIKLEVIGDDDLLQPDVFGLIEAAGDISRAGFKVFPYTTEDSWSPRNCRRRLRSADALGAPIGSGRGLNNVFGLQALRKHFPSVPLIVDAGIGTPAHAAAAMELGYDAVLLQTAIAKAGDPVMMARAFARAVEAGRLGYCADPIPPREMAEPSTPQIGRAFSDLSKRA